MKIRLLEGGVVSIVPETLGDCRELANLAATFAKDWSGGTVVGSQGHILAKTLDIDLPNPASFAETVAKLDAAFFVTVDSPSSVGRGAIRLRPVSESDYLFLHEHKALSLPWTALVTWINQQPKSGEIAIICQRTGRFSVRKG